MTDQERLGIQESAERQVATWERAMAPYHDGSISIAAQEIDRLLGPPMDLGRDAMWDIIYGMPAAYVWQQVWPKLKESKDWPRIRDGVVRRRAEEIEEARRDKEE